MMALLPERADTGWAAALDPRLRILAALLFALTVVALQRPAPLAIAFTLALVLALNSGIGAGELLRRVLLLELFMLVLLLTLPFTVAGEPLLRLGGLTASGEGVRLALIILLRANAVLLMLLALLGTLESARLGYALARLGVPERLTHLLLLTVRQIQLVGDEYQRLRQAMRARAFVARADRHGWNSLGWLMGMLLVRSLGRSRRLLDAMRCRGFDGRLRLLHPGPDWRRGDTAVLTSALLLSAALLMLDRLPALAGA
jgi:cobalt/nickel transport system permease protein